MTVKKKLIVCFIFLAGFLVTGISIARYLFYVRASDLNFTCKLYPNALEILRTNFLPIIDEYVDVGVLSLAEVNVAMVCPNSLLL